MPDKPTTDQTPDRTTPEHDLPDVIHAAPGAELLKLAPAPAGRFIYSNHFMPRQLTFKDGKTPAVPFYTKQRLLELSIGNVVENERLRELTASIAGQQFWDKNQLDQALENYTSGSTPNEDHGDHPARRGEAGVESVTDAVRASVLGDQDGALVNGMLRPDIGYVFLDRTSVTPAGIALGENVYSLSLAPAEEVTLEQKTYSKRETSFEDQNEQERQFDLELDSSYTTELERGFERQQSQNSSWGLTASETVSYTSPESPYGSITASETVGVTTNASQANQESSRRSVKDSQQASSKVAAKYRAVHKTTFKVSTDQGFEASSKRTIRNPNTATPITLLYFKVMQRLKLRQERYGVRMCWAISVKDPAAVFALKLQRAREAAVAEALALLPAEPQPPPPPSTTGQPAPGPTRELGVASSEVHVADKWGLTGDMSADYDVDVPIPDQFHWDGNTANVHVELFSRRPANTIGANLVGVPTIREGFQLRVRIHIGAPSWIGGPGIQYQVRVGTYKDVSPPQQASEDEAYHAALLAYQTAHQAWQDKHGAALESGRAVGEQRVQQMIAQLSPVNEMISQLIEREFPASRRDEMWEIDLWQRMFEWQRASYLTYPSWWSGGSMRDPLGDPENFLNASWVKLYLPVRIGHELEALRWVFGKSVDTLLDVEIEARFAEFVKDLETFRTEVFGAAGELEPLKTPCQPVSDRSTCLAQWEEYLPTDGTHLEVIQGSTSAADGHVAQEMRDAAALRAGILAQEQAETDVARKATALMKTNASVAVNIGAGNGKSPGA